MLRCAGLVLLAAASALVGAAFLITAFYRWLAGMFPNTLAAAVVGGAMVVLAAMSLALALRPRRQSLGPADLILAVLGFASGAVRTHPEKAVLAAIVAGVLNEWLDNKPKETADLKEAIEPKQQ